MSMSLLIKPIMAEDALFAFIPGYPVRYVFLCRVCVPSDRDAAAATPPPRRYVVKNIPMEMVVAGTDSASVSLNFWSHGTSTQSSWS